jgi:hypothetical protein
MATVCIASKGIHKTSVTGLIHSCRKKKKFNYFVGQDIIEQAWLAVFFNDEDILIELVFSAAYET